MSMQRNRAPFIWGGFVLAIGIGLVMPQLPQQAEAMTILQRIDELNSETPSNNRVRARTFSLMVIDRVMDSLHELESAALLGLTSEDPEIVEMSEALLSTIEVEMDALRNMRDSRVDDLVPELRGRRRIEHAN